MSSAMLALLGGVLIGLSATLLLLFNGRIAGASGILNGLIQSPRAGDALWRVAFLTGLIGAGTLTLHWLGRVATSSADVSLLIVGGLLVGFGTRMGNGCTSGHGVCGLGRLSKRSLIAVVTFMLTAIITVFVMRHVLGAAT